MSAVLLNKLANDLIINDSDTFDAANTVERNISTLAESIEYSGLNPDVREQLLLQLFNLSNLYGMVMAKEGNSAKAESTLDIQHLNISPDPIKGDTLTEACIKCNHNFKQLSPDAEMINVGGLSLTGALKSINRVLHKNSQLLGYNYEPVDYLGMPTHRALLAIFEQIEAYFKTLVQK